MKIIAYSVLALMGVLAVLVLAGCGAPVAVTYTDPETGIAAGYSSKGGLSINYHPVADK